MRQNPKNLQPDRPARVTEPGHNTLDSWKYLAFHGCKRGAILPATARPHTAKRQERHLADSSGIATLNRHIPCNRLTRKERRALWLQNATVPVNTIIRTNATATVSEPMLDSRKHMGYVYDYGTYSLTITTAIVGGCLVWTEKERGKRQ